MGCPDSAIMRLISSCELSCNAYHIKMDTFTQRKSIRLKNYNYSQSGYYFITICTQNRECLFGDIVDGKMIFYETGKIVEYVWKSLPNHHPVELDAFQIMPNHVHMIIHIVGRGNIMGRENPAPTILGPIPLGHVYGSGNPTPTLGQIIAYFKYESTKQINQYYVRAGIIPPNTIKKIFQRNYYEHIIRNEDEYMRIKQYIRLNPQIWKRDRNNPIFEFGA